MDGPRNREEEVYADDQDSRPSTRPASVFSLRDALRQASRPRYRMQIAIEKGRATRPDINLGICGEHGGDADSVKFWHRIGLSYVSCSPFRVPVARLAAAQAAIEEKRKAAKPAKKK